MLSRVVDADGPMSAVASKAVKMVPCRERSDVPEADIRQRGLMREKRLTKTSQPLTILI